MTDNDTEQQRVAIYFPQNPAPHVRNCDATMGIFYTGYRIHSI